MALKKIDNSPTGKKYNRSILFIVFTIAVVIMIDISIIRHYIIVESSSSLSIYVFIIISTIFMAAQYFLLKFARYNIIKSDQSKKISSYLDLIGRAVRVIQYILIAILIFIILQMLLTSHF